MGFATFISRGGKMKMVINHILSQKDKETIWMVEDRPDEIKVFDLTDIATLHQSLDEYGKHFFECLAYLILQKRIEIKVIKPKTGKGIAHYKSGIFSDGKDAIGYKASCNFTYYGLSENIEELEAFLSWENGRSNKLINKERRTIENYFNESDDNVDYLSSDEIEVVLKDSFAKKDIDELLVQEEQLLKKKMNLISNPKTKESIFKLFNNLEISKNVPRFPYLEGPREYQKIAFENWKNNKQQGLFAMATGTGKTITSLNCLLEVYKKTGYYKGLILVPTITLVNQWEQECKKFNFGNIIKVNSKSEWKEDFSTLITRENISKTEDISFVVISTYASFSKRNVFNEINQLSPKTLLIADECHNMGSGVLLKLLSEINCKRRIGLSATPERQFGNDINNQVFSFFNSRIGYTYEYSMAEAITNNVLCRYYYYPHLVSLNNEEMIEYKKLSLKISKFYNAESESFNQNPVLTALLLARKRIVHKASNKLFAFNKILKQQFESKGNLKFTLVYVPEGIDNSELEDESQLNENLVLDSETTGLIDVYTNLVKNIDNRLTIKQFISDTKEKENVLDMFAKGEIDVLTSMKCLDEGVDVPRAELAIFCASTGNPRQFIQRRGRILRKHIEKQFALIHDLVVIPQISQDGETFKMERNMLKKELERVKNFSELAENSSHTIDVLLDTMNYYNLNLYENE
ncbi:MAG: DEAD/DEAH box helicase family protein [Bacteroidota bacterium]|nr:DEAD/DEAH box helicase family protein [Bacteroidota bacterium]